jgi:hypothetical protein
MLKLLALALVVGQTTDSPTCNDATADQVANTLPACVQRNSVMMEKSGETADTVATAVIYACGAELRFVRDAIEKCRGPERARSVDEIWRKRLREQAIADVVDIRAKRHR